MHKTVQRVVTLLLALLMICGMFPAAFATDVAPEDTITDTTLPAEEVHAEETTAADDPTTDPTESTAPADSTEPTATDTTEPPAEEETLPVSDLEEDVTASMVGIGAENVPMLMATRAAIKGTHYHRAIIWLSSADSKLSFTYKSKDYSVDRLYVHGVVVDGSRYVAYCIDPGVITTESSGGYSSSETAWTALDIDTQTAIGLAILYGAPNGMSSSTKKTMLTYEFATQIIIHEILLGYRSALPPFECTNDKIITKFGTDADGSTNGKKREITSGSTDYSSLHGEYINRTTLREAYDTIAANMASHYVLPSFASRYDAAAQIYEMTKQSDGTYSVTLTDTNGVLANCLFENGNGLTYTVNGNQLTITSDGPFDEVKSCAMTADGGISKNVPNLTNESFLVWQSGSYQRLVTLLEPQNDPMPLYFNVTAKEENGVAQIIKTATNGGTVAGWHFTLKDSTGTVVGNYVTDATGIITMDLEPGTYTVTETDTDAKYWVNDPTPTKTVTVMAGETTKVTFQNQWRGQAQIIKTTTNGGTVKGWEFTIKDSSGSKVGTYTTDDSGIIVVDLEPGTYTVTETDRNNPYWYCDTEPKTVTVRAGETASVTFQNQWIGKAKIIKTLANPEAGSVEGWTFTITDANGKEIGSYQTDSTGTILTDLVPGSYTVTEVPEDDSLWQCTTANPQTITVVAGETAEVTFTNALRPAQITVYKVDPLGAPLADAEFLLEWSENGTDWKAVNNSTSQYVVKGGCTSADLTNGKVTSGRDGVVSFTGLYPNVLYRLTETKAPEGYNLQTGVIFQGKITVQENLTVEKTVVNSRPYELPMTGSAGSTILRIAQIASVAVLLALLLYHVKKRW